MTLVIRNSRKLIPKNNSSVNIARSAIDQILPAAVQQYQNALSVNGFPIIYYRKRTTGIQCTCCGPSAADSATLTPDELESGVTILTDSGAGSDEYINSMLHGSVFSIGRYGSRQHAVDANGGDNPQRSTPNSPLRQSVEVHNKGTDFDDPFVDELHPSSTEDLFSEESVGSFDAGNSTAGCAVCLGTGFVGGYDPTNALRTVYDSHASWSGDLTVDLTTKPNSWTLLGGKQISVPVLLPAGAVGIEAFRLWNNRDQIFEFDAKISIASTLKPFHQIEQSDFDGYIHTLVLTFGEDVEKFTHLELQFQMGVSPVYAEWSRLNYNENLQVAEGLDASSLVLSPTIPHVSLYDVVAESVYRKLWKISSTNPAIDRERQVNGWEVTARLIQAYEILSLLPRRMDRVWYSASNVTQPVQDKPSYVAHDPYADNHSSRVR